MDKKALSLPLLIALVVGNVVGTGIYVLPASLAEYGSIAFLGWIITSIVAIFLALTLTDLTKRFPKTGGPYIYCKEAFGNLVGFVIAYIYWSSYLVSVAAVSVATVSYLGFITPVLDANTPAYSPSFALIVQLLFLWLFTLINIIGIHTAGVAQLILTIIKLIPLILISVIGLAFVKFSNFPSFSNHHSFLPALSNATTLTFWAFVGLEAATIPAENTRGYRDIYKATIFGTSLASCIYILSTFVLMGMIPANELSNSQFPFAKAGIQLFGSHAAILIALCAVISCLGTLNSCILIQGQIVFAAARDHLFPHRFAKLSKHDVPIAAQILSSTLVSFLLILSVQKTLLAQFNNIALLASLLTLATYFTSALAEVKFLWQSGVNPLKTKWALIPIFAAGFSAWIIFSFKINILASALLLIVLCVPIYYFTIKK